MKKLLWQTPKSTVFLHRPDHEDGKYTVHTRIDNDAALERNKRLRLEQVGAGARIPWHDNEQVEFAYSIPNEQWAFFKRDYPDVVSGLRSKDHSERVKAATRLSILHPEWVVKHLNKEFVR